MNESIQICDLETHAGAEAALRGWVAGRRSGGKIVFLILRDGTGQCQCVVEAGAQTAFTTAEKLPIESSIAVHGTVRADARSTGGYEVAVSRLDVLHEAEDYPIARKAHGIDFLMSHRHLWLRSARPTAILRIRDTLIRSIRSFFHENGFTLIDTPILTAGVGEDAQSLFPVEYFGSDAYLTQTGQLHLESACMALGRVYCFGPTFRAEKSKTRRHLTEFWMVEPEMAFADLDDALNLAEDLVCRIVADVLEENVSDLALLDRNPAPLRMVCKPFARVTYSEAVDMLHSVDTRKELESRLTDDRKALQALVDELAVQERHLQDVRKPRLQEKARARILHLRESIHDLEEAVSNAPDHIRQAQEFPWGKDLGGSDETILSNRFRAPLFITHYPKTAKAFYMKEDPDDPSVVLNMDLLAPEGYGEIIGGSQREDSLDRLYERLKEKQLDETHYDWYLDLRRYGSVPHAGFGLGLERTLAWLCGVKHVRETIPFPRTMGRMTP